MTAEPKSNGNDKNAYSSKLINTWLSQWPCKLLQAVTMTENQPLLEKCHSFRMLQLRGSLKQLQLTIQLSQQLLKPVNVPWRDLKWSW